ncbi:aspartate aminotransferase family protein [Candidatus Marinamargulisbacteria bacterium SCGC AG-343-K17]|nr:aspartate aminotransferase family protein [Candidatus Marinamargulisbacteria bacterium SCGC AG-343-K17]
MFNTDMMPNLIERSNASLSNVLSHATQLQIERGEGSYLIDYQGHRYLDFGAGIAVNSTGHCHPTVVNAIQQQSQTLLHGCAGVVYYDQNISLAERLGKMSGLNSVFFTQSGTEAVEAALKCAVYVKNKQGIIAFNGSFHGRTLGALSVTTSNQKYLDRYPLAFSNRVILEYPNFYRNPAPMNNEDGYLDYLSKKLATIDTSTIGAIIIEPFMGEGGYVPCPGSVLKYLREWASDNDVFLIFDEIQSGIGRTGQWFYYDHFGITPDILTTAKGIASGLPLGACLSSKTIMDQWTTGSHGGTYGGNPLSCAAATATLNVLEPLLPKISELGQIAKDRLIKELESLPLIGHIRGEGLMIGIECMDSSGEPNPTAIKAIISRCLEKNLLILPCGKDGNVIRLMPPLTISPDELNDGLSILIESCHHVLS